MINVGSALMTIGGLIVLAGGLVGIIRYSFEEPRVYGFSEEDTELLMMPNHERLARQLAQIHGYPPFEWRRFTPLAVAEILRMEDARN